MRAFIEPLLELESFRDLLNNIKNKNTPVLTTGVIDVQKNQLVSVLEKELNCPAIIVAEDELKARDIYEDMLFFDKNAMFYPAKDIIFYNADVHSSDIVKERFRVIDKCIKGEVSTVVTSIDALFCQLMEKTKFEKYVLELNTGDIIEISELTKQLVFLGYESSEIVEGAGQFAVRGGIVDIYSPVENGPQRLEFWDDEIDSIRLMDALSQRSIEKTEKIRVFPMRELVYTEEESQKARDSIKKELKKTLKIMESHESLEAADTLNETIGDVIYKLECVGGFSGIENLIKFFCENPVNVLDYMPKNTMVFFDEPRRMTSHAESVSFEFSESIKSRIESGRLLPSQGKMVFSYSEIIKMASKFPQVLLSTVAQNASDFKIKNIISFSVKATSAFNRRMDLFCDEIGYLKKEGHRIIILGGARTRCERFVNELSEKGIVSAIPSDKENFVPTVGTVWVCPGKLSRGFEYPQIGFAVFADNELFGEEKKKKKKNKKKTGKVLESFTDLKVGDYVVHENHGIGIFRGLEKITVDGVNKDYMKISYGGGGNLFVPVSQMDLIQKYIGSDSIKPKLNKLGGQEWTKAKTKVKAAVAILAEDLVKLYAKRQLAEGFVYSRDNLWQREFEESFRYEETDDQLQAIEDVKDDMESPRVMDRLICGDVGYGKTEVAIRAAFKAVQDGKQVAYLVPTTILAQQHYTTFTQRMMDYPIRVELLSRFRTPKQQKETLKALECGMGDIVIGTHRILSKDVKFKDLGMVIVDEEQRFGVAHKEKLKRMKENVDVLTLTATPIPRTLHMSLSGVRDMSILEEPPQERHPIQTFVMESSDEFIRDAIRREISRGGQVYYLHNRVNNIFEVSAKIQNLVPDARVVFAHGQMTERELEGIMKDFIDGETDVLVCTTIIETGLDIPNVNTIIIQDADRMGLSQLYQLRGRVGRSNKAAYAYLMYRKNKVLQEVAEKRLQTIREFTEFGSGFKIAMRDLEIRGAGNLLGAEQHGHMESVGYDMYCKLLDEAVCQLRGEKQDTDFETTIDLNINAYIPEFYIKNEEQRLEIYKKIALVTTKDDYFDIQEEIEDRFGNLPRSVQCLLEIVLIKANAHRMDIVSIAEKNKNIIVTFKRDANINPAVITELIVENKNKYLFTVAGEPYITIKIDQSEKADSISYIKNLLQSLNSIESSHL